MDQNQVQRSRFQRNIPTNIQVKLIKRVQKTLINNIGLKNKKPAGWIRAKRVPYLAVGI